MNTLTRINNYFIELHKINSIPALPQPSVKLFYDKIIHKHTPIPSANQQEIITDRIKSKKRGIIYDTINVPNKKYVIKKPHELPVYKLKRGRCPECDSLTVCNDYYRGERVCSVCGLVLEDNMTDYKEPIFDNNYKEYSYNNIERHVIKSNGKPLYVADKGKWRKKQHMKFLQTVCSQLKLKCYQKELINYIFCHVSLSELHHTASFECIILAVCRYVMKFTGCSVYKLRFNRGFFSNRLDKKSYNLIESRINKKLPYLVEKV